MNSKSSLAQLATYVGVIAVALSMTAAGLSAVLVAANGKVGEGSPTRTLVQDQIESSRDIRRALATPITVPPLAPITARRAHEVPVAFTQRPTLSPKALNAMAMDQSATIEREPQGTTSAAAHNVRDHLTGAGW